MELTGTLLVLEDTQRAQKFYQEVLGRELLMDLGGNITFKGAPSLQDKKIWATILEIPESEIRKGGNNAELYFETTDFEGFMAHLAKFPEVRILSPRKEYPWGQTVVCFYDLDEHTIEVAQSMGPVVRRFIAEGMTLEEVAKHTAAPHRVCTRQYAKLGTHEKARG